MLYRSLKKFKVEKLCKELFELDGTKRDFYFRTIAEEQIVLPYELKLKDKSELGDGSPILFNNSGI